MCGVNWCTAVPDDERETAADSGARGQRLAEQLGRGAGPGFSSEEAPFVAADREFLGEHRPPFLAVEEMGVSLRHGYAGTLGSASAGVMADYIVVNMFAEAASGASSIQSAMQQAENRARRYYRARA